MLEVIAWLLCTEWPVLGEGPHLAGSHGTCAPGQAGGHGGGEALQAGRVEVTWGV